MRDLNQPTERQGHPAAGRNPPTGTTKAAKKTAGKTAAKKTPAKKTTGGRAPAVTTAAVARRAAAIAAMPAGSIPVVVMAIDFFTGKPVKVIIQGRNPPTGDQGGG
jgi:hypothetical protein